MLADRLCCAILIGFLSAPLAGCGASSATPDSSPLKAELELVPAVELSTDPARPTLAQRMDRYGVSAISLARIEDFEIVERSAFGTVARGGETPVTPETVFQAASISKPVTAIAVMSLVDDGQIALDVPAERYLETWQLPEDEAREAVTVRQLLSHTSGLGPQSYPGLERGTSPPSLVQILDGAPEAYTQAVSRTSPQGVYAYSGGGYMILQAIMEDITGQDFHAVMEERVFAPTGMADSTYHLREADDGAALSHGWTGDTLGSGWAEYSQAAAAGLWSTPSDLARLLVAYSESYSGREDGLLLSGSAQAMAQPVVSGMGLGFGVNGEGASLHISHAGWTLGYRAFLVFYPETGDGLVIMTNGQAGNHLIDDVLRTYARAHNWPDFAQATLLEPALWTEARLSELDGRYRVTPAGFEITVQRQGAAFEIVSGRGSRYVAVPAGPDHMLITETGGEVGVDWETGTLTLWNMSATKIDPDDADD